MTDQERMRELDIDRLRTSLVALRRDIREMDLEIDRWLDATIRKRRHLVDVVWTVKDALGDVHVDVPRELEMDEQWLALGVPPERVSVLRAIREASRPVRGGGSDAAV